MNRVYRNSMKSRVYGRIVLSIVDVLHCCRLFNLFFFFFFIFIVVFFFFIVSHNFVGSIQFFRVRWICVFAISLLAFCLVAVAACRCYYSYNIVKRAACGRTQPNSNQNRTVIRTRSKCANGVLTVLLCFSFHFLRFIIYVAYFSVC